MDIKRYKELKASGDVKLEKVDDTVHVYIKQYDPESGKLLRTQILPVDEPSLSNEKEQAHLLLDGFTEFLADIENVKVKKS